MAIVKIKSLKIIYPVIVFAGNPKNGSNRHPNAGGTQTRRKKNNIFPMTTNKD